MNLKELPVCDERSAKVVFLSHCLLNQNTRYLGGACRGCCFVREVVQGYLERDVGVVQMPCPEQQAWGGVLKSRMLRLYGLRRGHPWLYRLLARCFPLLIACTRLLYARLARRVAGEIEDYVRSGFEVVGVVAVDGSPSCGLQGKLDLRAAFEDCAGLELAALSGQVQNELVGRHAQPGAGILVEELRKQLAVRNVEVPFSSYRP